MTFRMPFSFSSVGNIVLINNIPVQVHTEHHVINTSIPSPIFRQATSSKFIVDDEKPNSFLTNDNSDVIAKIWWIQNTCDKDINNNFPTC